jgi:hypothetical protein
MVSVLTSSVVDRGFETRSSQTKIKLVFDASMFRLKRIVWSKLLNKKNHRTSCELKWNGVSVMVHNATFNNISVISWRSALLVEETCCTFPKYIFSVIILI